MIWHFATKNYVIIYTRMGQHIGCATVHKKPTNAVIGRSYDPTGKKSKREVVQEAIARTRNSMWHDCLHRAFFPND